MDEDGTSDSPLDNLYQALIESFGVIICGYIAGRLGFVTEQQSAGLSTFVGTFSLPSLIFLSLVTLDLSSVSWYFLLSIFLAKAIVFIVVLLITLLVTRPVDPARAGLYAIFSTQSNDFAIGFPIVVSIYKNTHPEFLSYVWLLAPINLVMLNPIGFVLMELGKARERTSTAKLASGVLTSIVTNPVVFMTALGMIMNLILHHTLPVAVYSLLNVFGSAFTATALFLLGLRMVGSVRNFRGAALFVPALLIAVKELVLPLVIREVVSSLLRSTNVNSTTISDMSTFGFLYGTFPAAPGVFVYASTFSLDVDLIAGAMVASTFLSAPIMFISAKMISVSNLSPKDFDPALSHFEFDISIAGILAAVILLFVFAFKQNFFKMPQRITTFLIFSQLISCFGVLIGKLNIENITYISYSLVRFGDYSWKIWTACLAISLAFIEEKKFTSLMRLQPLFIGIAWGIPFAALGAILLISKPERAPLDTPDEFYGPLDAPITISIILFSIIISMVYMILQQRYKRRHARYLVYSREASETYDAPNTSEVSPQREEEQPVLEEYPGDSDETQPTHHIALLFFLVGSIFVTLSLCMWRVVMDYRTGVYVELAFLDTALTRGQNIITLFIFGFDIISFFQPLFKRFVDSFSNDSPTLPTLEDIPSETQHLCDQFTTYHMEPCRAQIVKRKRLKLWEFVLCFPGEDLVSWLLGEGLVKDREEGVVYGGHLLSGRLIRRLAGPSSHQFTDDAALFTFSD